MQGKRVTGNYLENRAQFQCRLKIEGLKTMIAVAVLIINNVDQSLLPHIISIYYIFHFIIIIIL